MYFVDPIILVWIGALVLMVLLFIVLMEFHRNEVRRDHEEMFGKEDFELKCIEYGLSEKECHTMDKLVRRSVFSNMDALFNSAHLFEDAVNRFYEYRDLDKIRDITLGSVTGLRRKLGFTIANPDTPFISTRQLEEDSVVKVSFQKNSEMPMKIVAIDEKIFKLDSESPLPPDVEKGRTFAVRWIRPGDAIYTAICTVFSVSSNQILFEHQSKIDKFQLRRWVRESVDFHAVVDYRDGSTGFGCLLDLSAGGILVGLDRQCEFGTEIFIDFELPSYGKENVKIRILRNISRKDDRYPNLILHSAEFSGEFGWTQEKVLQYIFEVRRHRETPKEALST